MFEGNDNIKTKGEDTLIDDIFELENKIKTEPKTEQPQASAPMFNNEMMTTFAQQLGKSIADSMNAPKPMVKVPEVPKGFYIPDVDKFYVKWGIFADIDMIMKRKMFYPCFITGLSGNGKTMSIEQAAAANKRELVIVNITQETDEDDLLGGYRLIDGNTVWQDGPVVKAMERGCPLLLDEIDYGSSKLSCLQSVLSGKPVLIKKTGEVVKPKTGFTVFATANTKGQGDVTGKFAGANILNEAFLDRFPIMLHNPYPNEKVEGKILLTALTHLKAVYGDSEVNDSDRDFIIRVVKWTKNIRTAFDQGSITDVVSTRRAVDIIKAYIIYNDRAKAIKTGIERFNDEVREKVFDLYSYIDNAIKKESDAKQNDGGLSARQAASQQPSETVMSKNAEVKAAIDAAMKALS